MTTNHLLETETTGISCQNRFKSQRVAFDLPLPGDCQSGEAWMLVQSCSISVTMGEGFRWLPSTSSNQDLWVRRINWLKEGFPFHTLIHIAQWAVPFYVTRWRVWVCDLVTSNRMIIEKKGLTINGFTTYHNQFFLTAGTHRWPDGASTTKHSFVSQRLLDGRWPPAVSCKKLPTANCSLLGVWCLWLIVRPTPPPHIHLDMTFFYYHDFFSDCFPRFKGSIPKYEKQRLIVLAQLKILLAWSADHVSWKQTLTHTHTQRSNASNRRAASGVFAFFSQSGRTKDARSMRVYMHHSLRNWWKPTL